MKQVAELLGIIFDLRIVAMDLDNNDIPYEILYNIRQQWHNDNLALQNTRRHNNVDSTFVQRAGIALYKCGIGKRQPIWKRGSTNVHTLIEFLRKNCEYFQYDAQNKYTK